MDVLELGNLDSKRDWGHAKDYVEAMWLMLQQDEPSDYVIATGESHSVREFVEASFRYVGIKIIWEGKGVSEVGKDAATGIVRVKINPKYFRPTEVDFLLGDPTKAKNELGWKPKVTFLVSQLNFIFLEIFFFENAFSPPLPLFRNIIFENDNSFNGRTILSFRFYYRLHCDRF